MGKIRQRASICKRLRSVSTGRPVRVYSLCLLLHVVPVVLVESGQVHRSGLLAAYRFLIDSRDTETDARLDNLNDAFSVFRCHSIMNCVSVCPKGLNPTRAIGHIKSMLLQRGA